MKSVGVPFVILVLLATVACGRQASGSAADGSDDSTVMSEGDGRPSVPHDPRAMTAIDVATGDLSGLANYAGGRVLAPPAYRAATSGQAVSSAQQAEGAIAAAQDGIGPQASPAAPATTENSAADVDRASAPGSAATGPTQTLP